MQYETALALWGARKIEQDSWRPRPISVDPATVVVQMDFSDGYACCGGSDPSCYCSQAESPVAQVTITGDTFDGPREYTTIEVRDLDLHTILRELLDVSGGAITDKEAVQL